LYLAILLFTFPLSRCSLRRHAFTAMGLRPA
jgi:hypothetical protein